MANLTLIHELRERIAAASSTPPNNSHDVALETRFRAVLPNLLQAHVVPSPSGTVQIGNLNLNLKLNKVNCSMKCERNFGLLAANEREVIAILRLIGYTAKHFPGVFYHGKASAILPMLGRILAFFAEPEFR